MNTDDRDQDILADEEPSSETQEEFQLEAEAVEEDSPQVEEQPLEDVGDAEFIAAPEDSPDEHVQDESTEEDHDEEGEEDDDEVEDEDEEVVAKADGEEVEDFIPEDPHQPAAFDLERGERIDPPQHDNQKEALPWKSKVKSAKEFFAQEILYRYDILLPEEQKDLLGKYRVELKGYRGGVWSLDVADEIEVVNKREEADVVIAMQQKDFLHVVNGELNPQLAILAEKIKVTGDIKRAVAFQSLLYPTHD